MKSTRVGSNTHREQSTELALLQGTCSKLGKSLIRSNKLSICLPQEALPSPALRSQPHVHFFATADHSHAQGSLKGIKKKIEEKKKKQTSQPLSITKPTLFFLLLLKHQKNIRPGVAVFQQCPFPSLWLNWREERVFCGDISRRSLTSTTEHLMAAAAFLASPRGWHSNAARCCRESLGKTNDTVLTAKSTHLFTPFYSAGISSVL